VSRPIGRLQVRGLHQRVDAGNFKYSILLVNLYVFTDFRRGSVGSGSHAWFLPVIDAILNWLLMAGFLYQHSYACSSGIARGIILL
jgi:hypothetical protein